MLTPLKRWLSALCRAKERIAHLEKMVDVLEDTVVSLESMVQLHKEKADIDLEVQTKQHNLLIQAQHDLDRHKAVITGLHNQVIELNDGQEVEFDFPNIH